ncbi:MAG: DUF2975 domain-containing protein [Phocaeicola sp.]
MKRLKLHVLALALVMLGTIVPNFLNSFIVDFSKGMKDAQEKHYSFYFSFKNNLGNSSLKEISFQGIQVPTEIETGSISISKDLLETAIGTPGYKIYLALHISMLLLCIPCLLGLIWVIMNIIKLICSILNTQIFEEKNITRISHIGYILLGIEVINTIFLMLSYYTTERLFNIAPFQMNYWSVLDKSYFILPAIILVMNELLRIAITMKKEQELTI